MWRWEPLLSGGSWSCTPSVADMFQEWAQEVAHKLHVLRHSVFTMPAKDLAFVLKVPEFLESRELPLNAAHGAMKGEKLLLPVAFLGDEARLINHGEGAHRELEQLIAQVHAAEATWKRMCGFLRSSGTVSVFGKPTSSKAWKRRQRGLRSLRISFAMKSKIIL